MNKQLPIHLNDPPFLSVGTEVSAKYKGAFCEAKIKSILKVVKCKVQYSNGSVSVVPDDMIIGPLKVGTTVQIKCNDKIELIEAIIQKIHDFSQYTVVFNDGDIACLKRSSLCLKSGKHFVTNTFDQLSSPHPDRNSVINKRKTQKHTRKIGEIKDILQKEENNIIGKVICVQTNDKKKKNNWFPGLIVSPTAQQIIKTNILIDYLVRSFKDGKYYTVPKNEIKEFTKEIASKVESSTLKTAVEKAILYLDNDELPPHWDRELLFGIDKNYITSDSEMAYNTDTSDEESIEEKDHFVAQLFKFMDDRGTPINEVPVINDMDVDLYKLFKVVNNFGGYNKVNKFKRWKVVAQKIGHQKSVMSVKQLYQQYLHSFEDFYRKLGCTMINHTRNVRSRNSRFSRSIIRDIDKAQPVPIDKNKPILTKQESSGKKNNSVKNIRNEEKLSSSINDKKKNNSNKLPVKWDAQILENAHSKIKKEDSVETETVSINKRKNVFEKAIQKTVRTLKTSDTPLLGSRKIRAIKKNIKTFVKATTPFKKAKKNTCTINQHENLPKLTRFKSKEDIPPIKRKLSVLSNHDDSLTESTSSGLNVENSNKIKHFDNSISEKMKKKIDPLNEDFTISIGDNLVVFYGDNNNTTTYDAKVLNICNIEGKIKYFVHYKGWNSRYDEFIDFSRIALKCNSPESDDVDSLKCEKKNIDQKKLEKVVNRTRRSVTPSQVSKKLPSTSSVRLTKTCDKSLTAIDGNSDSETECLENTQITKQHNKKSYLAVKNIKTETDVAIKTEPSDIDQNKKLNLKTYLTKEMLIQKHSPKKLKSCAMNDNVTEKNEIYDHDTLKKQCDFNLETESSTSNLNKEHIEETRNDFPNINVQSESKTAPNHYLSPKEKFEIHNQQQMFNKKTEVVTENSVKPQIPGYRSSSDNNVNKKKRTKLAVSICKSAYGNDTFDIKIMRSDLEHRGLSTIDSYLLGNRLGEENLESTKLTADDIYEFKENEPCDLKINTSINEDTGIITHKIAEDAELPNSYNSEKSIELSKVIDKNESMIPLKCDKNDEKFTKTPNLKESSFAVNRSKELFLNLKALSSEFRSRYLLNRAEIEKQCLNEPPFEINESAILGKMLKYYLPTPEEIENGFFTKIDKIEFDDNDDDDSKLIEEINKTETNCQIDTDEYNSPNRQIENTEKQSLLPQTTQKLANTDSELQSSLDIPKNIDDESTISCNESLQNDLTQNVEMYTHFENQPDTGNIYQFYADNDNSIKSGFEFKSNSISPTIEHTDNIQSILNKPKTYENDIKNSSSSKNENVIFPELECKEIFDENTLNNDLVTKYSRKSLDYIHKPSTSKRFFDSIHESSKDNYETETSSNFANNDGKNEIYENIACTKINNSFDKPLKHYTNKKNCSADKDINNVLFCEESIPGSPNGVLEDQEKISVRQEKKETDNNRSICENKNVASIIYGINQSFNKPMMTFVGASNEEINEYTNIIKNHGILDHRHLQFLADVSNKKRSLIKPAELDVEQTVTKTKYKNSHEHNSVLKRSKMSSTTISTTEGSNVQNSTEIKISIPQEKGNSLDIFTKGMSSVQRQAIILAKINELRKEYLLIKNRLSLINRRRKKIKKRKKELFSKIILANIS